MSDAEQGQLLSSLGVKSAGGARTPADFNGIMPWVVLALCSWCRSLSTPLVPFFKMLSIPGEVADLPSGGGVGDYTWEADLNINDAIIAVDQMPDDCVLVAKPPLTWGAPAMFVKLTGDYRVPEKTREDGYEYLLGKEDIENLLKFLKKKKMSNQTVAEFIIHYAINDSPPFWIKDIPDI